MKALSRSVGILTILAVFALAGCGTATRTVTRSTPSLGAPLGPSAAEERTEREEHQAEETEKLKEESEERKRENEHAEEEREHERSERETKELLNEH